MNTVCKGASFSFLVKEDRLAELTGLLDTMKADPGENKVFGMKEADHLHYATWVIAPKEKIAHIRPPAIDSTDDMLPVRLLLLTTYWGRKNEHIHELAELNPGGLHQILSCCYDYPEKNISSNRIYRFMKRSGVSNTVYNPFQFATVKDIRDEELLRNRIEDFLDDQMNDDTFAKQSPKNIQKAIQDFVKKDKDISHLAQPWKTGWINNLDYRGPWILTAGVALLVVLILLLGLIHANPVSHIVCWLSLVFIVVLAFQHSGIRSLEFT